MKRNIRIPTFLGLAVVFLGIVGGVFLLRSRTGFFSKAESEITPKQVRITNIAENSFSVSWVTDKKTQGHLLYGESKDFLTIANDDRDQLSGEKGSFYTHHVTVRGLKPNTDYFFKIVSDGENFDNNGSFYQVKTGPSLSNPPPNDIVYGTVLKPDGTPAGGVIVYLSLANASPLSTLTRSSGTWAIPLNLSRTSDLSSWLSYDKEASVLEIFIQGGIEGVANGMTTTKNDSPVPPITLGKDFDFRQSLPSPALTPTPSPLVSDTTSGFEIEESASPSYELKIINPEENDKVSTSTPEIFGVGPPGEKLTITVESPETFTGEVIVNEDGSWRWTPPGDLSPGEHKVTITLADGRKISRSFTVLAADEVDLPSFTSSPSASLSPTPSLVASPTATLTPTPTPTPTLTSTPTPTLISTPSATPTIAFRSALPSTESGVPVSGTLTPTILLVIIGMGLIIFGFLGISLL